MMTERITSQAGIQYAASSGQKCSISFRLKRRSGLVSCRTKKYNNGPSTGKKSDVSPPAFNTTTAKAELKNRLAVWPGLFANAKSSASVNPANRVAMEARSYRLV